MASHRKEVVDRKLTTASIQISGDMIDKIVLRTNEEGQQVFGDWNQFCPNCKKTFVWTDALEIKAFLGIKFTAGAWHENTENPAAMWITSEAFRRDIYTATISKNLFKLVLEIN